MRDSSTTAQQVSTNSTTKQSNTGTVTNGNSSSSPTMPSATDPQLLYQNLQTLCISAPDVPSPPFEHRTIMNIDQQELDQPPTHWPQDIWLNSPSYRVLYQPVLVVPHPPQLSASPPLQQPGAGSDAPMHHLSQHSEEEPRPEESPANGVNGHGHATT
ncbi:hypothetical protein FDECE_11075, partial [Fusarium decemcellulare]